MPNPASTRLALVGPVGTDAIALGDDVIRAIITRLEAVGAGYIIDVAANRPTAATANAGYAFVATDTGIASWSTGSAWIDINPKDAAAGTASLRTLGTGATQAAAGNDSRLSDTRTPTDATVTWAKLASALLGNGAHQLIDALTILQDFAATALQAGVVGSGDAMVTQHGAGANMTVDAAAGTCWVKDGTTGALVCQTVPATPSIAVNTAHATLPRVDSIYTTTTNATPTYIAGTATTGATLDNRTGAPTLPANSQLLADILVGAAASSLSNSVIRDRRPRARGFNYQGSLTSGDVSGATSMTLIAAGLNPRIECSGVGMVITLHAIGLNDTNTDYVATGLFLDGAAIASTGQLGYIQAAAASQQGFVGYTYFYTPSAGSHKFGPTYTRITAGTATIKANPTTPVMFSVREIVADTSANNVTTSG